MEKLVSKRIEKNAKNNQNFKDKNNNKEIKGGKQNIINKKHKIDENNKRNTKQNKITQKRKIEEKKKKDNYFIKQLQKNWLKLLILSILSFACIFVSYLTFRTDYFYFISRPKIFDNGSLLVVLFSLFCLVSFGLFLLQTLIEYNSIKKEELNTNEKIKESTTDKDKIKKGKGRKNTNFILGLLSILFCILICAFFNFKVLWLSTFLCFVLLALQTYNLLKPSEKDFWVVIKIVNLLLSICIFLSFYFIYLLN